MTPTNLIEQLERDEGKRPSAYQDSLGFWTIGIGTCIDARKGCGLTDDEIDLLCKNRVEADRIQIEQSFPYLGGLDEVRMGALQNMVYQMGVHGVSGFRTMLDCLRTEDWAGAADAMLDSMWAKTQSPARAARLALQVRSGKWQ